jgi:hypothetical protein
MTEFGIGDLVEVKKDGGLSPALRFYHNKKGIIINRESESHSLMECYTYVAWKVIFPNQKTAVFKDYELILVSSANKKS